MKLKICISLFQVKAYEEDQKYKEGKFIVEKAYMSKQGRAPVRRRISSDDNEESSGQRRATSSNAALGGRDSASFNLSNILPALRGQLLRQALGLGRIQSANNRESSDDEFELWKKPRNQKQSNERYETWEVSRQGAWLALTCCSLPYNFSVTNK